MPRIAVRALACIVLALFALAQSNPEPTVSKDPLTDDQIAIYRAILDDAVPSGNYFPLLTDTTVPFILTRHTHCANSEPAPLKPVVHRLTTAVVTGKHLTLVQSRPSVPRSGVLTLSEIAFDSEHASATVKYDFRCGARCGGGKATELKKIDGNWRITGTCSRWLY